MSEPRPDGTQWFSVRRRELMVLAVVVVFALVAAAVGPAIRSLWQNQGVRVQSSAVVQPVRLNINTAAEYELTMLPGVGPVTARAILRHREEHGPFGSINELTQVKGIGPKTMESIRPHAMCAPPP